MFDLTKLFIVSVDPSLLLFGNYSPWLVALSVLIAIFTSGMALQLAGMARLSDHPVHKQVAIITGSVALGGGIWSMHFIGMLAFRLCTPVTYDPTITMLSMLPSIAASWVALQLLARPKINKVPLVVGGVLVGAGIGAMHYSGMAAMQMAPLLRYDPWFFALSIVVAVVLAMLALWIRFGVMGWRKEVSPTWAIVISGIVMGCAISGMHYTGMAAARFVGTPSPGQAADLSQTTFVALAVSLITVALTIFVAAANGLLRYRQLFLQMQASESHLRSVVDTAADGLVTIDGNGLIQSFNPAAERVFGWRADEVIGKSIALLLNERETDGDAPGGTERRRNERFHATSPSREVMAMRKDGSPLPIRMAIGRVDLPGQVLYVAFITDISEQRRMQGALREAKERAELAAASKTTFLANMSHEIRTPMNAIIGFTELLLNTPLDNMQQRHLTTVRNSARSLLGLLNDILDTAKLEKNAVELEHEDFSLQQLAQHVTTSFHLTAQSKGLALTLDYDPALSEFFKGDTLRIQQILTNLMGNAVKFTERGGVRLHIFPDRGQVHFALYDTGIGIPADRLEKIFDPFAQADPSMSRRFGGTGLGTTIARQLVELMKGRIWVESEPGRGSIFHVLLPLAVGQAVAPAATALPSQQRSLRVLVADDVDQNVELLQLALGNGGHQVTTATDGHQAVLAFLASRFDVVLMDVQMPGTDGLEATRRIRAHERSHGLAPTPIIALTASVQDHDRNAAREAGMNGFASKPIELHTLMAEIARVLGDAGPREAAAPPPAPASTEPIAWDQGAALWGSERALGRAIARFLDGNHLACRQLQGYLDQANPAQALQLVHRLRGTSGNLALRPLHDLLAQLEAELGAGHGDAARALLPLLEKRLIEVGAALQAAQPDTPDSAPAPLAGMAATDYSALKPLTQALADTLRRGEVDSARLQRLLAALRGDSEAARAHALDSAINDFDFDRAEKLLADLLGWLDQRISANSA